MILMNGPVFIIFAVLYNYIFAHLICHKANIRSMRIISLNRKWYAALKPFTLPYKIFQVIDIRIRTAYRTFCLLICKYHDANEICCNFVLNKLSMAKMKMHLVIQSANINTNQNILVCNLFFNSMSFLCNENAINLHNSANILIYYLLIKARTIYYISSCILRKDKIP